MRLPLIVAALFSLLWAQPEFSSCIEKNRLGMAEIDTIAVLAIDGERLLAAIGGIKPHALPAQWQLLNFDPLTGFAVVRAKHNLLPVAFRSADRMDEHPRLAVVSSQEAGDGIVQSRQEGLCGARLDRPLPHGSVVCAPCYAVVGVAMNGGFIESDYLRHLIDFDASPFYWGDLGFRLYGGQNRIRYVNPFFKNNPFRPEDEIVRIGGTEITDGRTAARAIALLKPGSTVTVVYRRDAQEHSVQVTAGPRLGGGQIADTFLEHLGWRLDQNLTVQVLLEEGFAGSRAIRPGDRLIQINKTVVTNSEQAQAALSGYDGPVKLLMGREGFHFFITLHTE